MFPFLFYNSKQSSYRAFCMVRGNDFPKNANNYGLSLPWTMELGGFHLELEKRIVICRSSCWNIFCISCHKRTGKDKTDHQSNFTIGKPSELNTLIVWAKIEAFWLCGKQTRLSEKKFKKMISRWYQVSTKINFFPLKLPNSEQKYRARLNTGTSGLTSPLQIVDAWFYTANGTLCILFLSWQPNIFVNLEKFFLILSCSWVVRKICAVFESTPSLTIQQLSENFRTTAKNRHVAN